MFALFWILKLQKYEECSKYIWNHCPSPQITVKAIFSSDIFYQKNKIIPIKLKSPLSHCSIRSHLHLPSDNHVWRMCLFNYIPICLSICLCLFVWRKKHKSKRLFLYMHMFLKQHVGLVSTILLLKKQMHSLPSFL